MPPDQDVDLSGVPPWVIRLVTDVVETKTIVTDVRRSMAEIVIRVEGFVTRREYDNHVSESNSLIREKLNPLWDDHQRLQGQVQANEQNTRRWRWAYGAALGGVAAYAALHSGGIRIGF